MKNLILLLVLVSGFMSGYVIGGFRGDDAREALQETIETEKTLDAIRENTISRLKAELRGINEKHQLELDAMRKAGDAKVAEWRRIKDGLGDSIRLSSAKLAASDARLKSLVTQRDGASAAERTRLDPEIERLQRERDELRREFEGRACLQAQIPHGVSDALKIANATGRKE